MLRQAPMVILCLLLTGCASTGGLADRPPAALPESERSRSVDLPSYRDLPSSAAPQMASLDMVAHLHVATLQLPPGASLAEWWLHGRAPDDAGALDRWHANGLDLTILPSPPRLNATAGALSRRGWGLTVNRDWTVLDIAPALPRGATLVYKRPLSPPQPLHLEPGRPRLLLRARNQDGRLALTLMPHHHQPQTSLQPRSVQDQMLDGRAFDDLLLTVQLSPGEVLVIAQRGSVTGGVAEPPAASTGPAQDASADSAATLAPAPAPEPPVAEADQVNATLAAQGALSLGDLLLTAVRLRQPTQTVLLLTVATAVAPDERGSSRN